VAELYCGIITPGAASQITGPTHFGLMKGGTWFPPLDVKTEYDDHGFAGGTTVLKPTCP
jgi:hypothetical protein